MPRYSAGNMDIARIEILLKSIDTSVRRIADALSIQSPPKIESGQAYTRRQASRLLNVSVWTIDQARRDGRLIEAQRIGNRHVRITGESLARFQQGRAGTRKVMRL